MNAARPLVQVFLDNGYNILLTHLSPAGLETGKKFFEAYPQVTHRYMPFDFFLMVQVFLRRARPACGIVLEVEIWPAMLIEADKLGIPMFMANGNLSEKKMPQLKTWKRSSLHLYRLFDHIFTKTKDYAARYESTGVLHRDLTVAGELKLDTPRDPLSIKKGQAWRKSWANKNFTFMISSSVQAEEELLIQCCVQLLKKVPKMRIVWVPRSPQRFDAINKKLKKQNLRTIKRSDLSNNISEKTQLLIGNSIGEMDLYLGMADVVFVGASFNNGGGHNIIEPLTAGCPVVMGPSTYCFDFIAKDAAALGVFYTFTTPGEMTTFIIEIAQSPQKLRQLKSASSTFGKLNIGAAEHCYKIIKSLN